MRKLGVIICNSGLGHCKRVLHVLHQLIEAREDLKIDVFVDQSKLKAFPGLSEELLKFGVNFYHIDADVNDYEEVFLSQYQTQFQGADWIWSDNLVFPLKYRKGVFITGSFVWADVVNSFDWEYECLAKTKPVMIGSQYFATPKIRELTDFRGVGIYNYTAVNKPKPLGQNILLSCGTTQEARVYWSNAFKDMTQAIEQLPKNVKVFLEPHFYETFSGNPQIIKACFDEEMFHKSNAAIIRPGMGTVCDVLLHGGRIFSFHEPGNGELEHNTLMLETLKVGERCTNVGEAFKKTLEYLNNQESQQLHLKHIQALNLQGLDQTVQQIKDLL